MGGTQLSEAVPDRQLEAEFSRHYAGRVAVDAESLADNLWMYAGFADVTKEDMIVQLSSLRLRLKCLEESIKACMPAEA